MSVKKLKAKHELILLRLEKNGSMRWKWWSLMSFSGDRHSWPEESVTLLLTYESYELKV